MPLSPTILSNWTLNPENIQSLREAIETDIKQDEAIQQFTTIQYGVKTGDPIATIGAPDNIGTKGGGCNPTYTNFGIANGKQAWELGEWHAPHKICYEDMLGTYAQKFMKGGTAIGDIDGNLLELFTDKFATAFRRAIWRMGWFGDTAADNIADGGVITAGVDPDLFTTADGLWKKLFAIGTADASKVTAIAANSQTTYAAQKSGILTANVATGIFDKFLTDAPTTLLSDPNGVVICTRQLANALMLDVRNTYKSNMEWRTIFDGFEVSEYFGIRVARCNIFDRFINEFENTGTKWNKPFRAVFTTIDNLRIGIDGDNVTNDFEVFFDQVARDVKLYASGFIGSAVVNPANLHLAY